jgi:hypothetical protein
VHTHTHTHLLHADAAEKEEKGSEAGDHYDSEEGSDGDDYDSDETGELETGGSVCGVRTHSTWCLEMCVAVG